ncbi:MAG: DUF3943 domain-containing protein [Anaeromyxobacter sp.]
MKRAHSIVFGLFLAWAARGAAAEGIVLPAAAPAGERPAASQPGDAAAPQPQPAADPAGAPDPATASVPAAADVPAAAPVPAAAAVDAIAPVPAVGAADPDAVVQATAGPPSTVPAPPPGEGLAQPAAASSLPGASEPLALAPARPPFWRDPVTVSVTESVAIHFIIMKWNKWVGEAEWAEITWDSVGANLQSAWVLDDDQFWVNQFGHPYQGTWSYTAARSAGLGFWTSSLYPFFSSLAWEYSGETLPPAINDQITTTVAGISLGEVLLRTSDGLWARGDLGSRVFSVVLAPMSAINRGWVGPRPARPLPSMRLLATAGGLGGDPGKDQWLEPGKGVPFGGLQVVYGVPADPDLRLDGPFDHFVFDASYGLTADPVSTMRIRGLIAGEPLAPAPDLRGLWGLYLTFSIDSPGPFRTSGSGLAVGTSLHWQLQDGLALEGSAVGTAVLLGAAGQIPSVGGAGRDYRFGPGAEGLLEAELLSRHWRVGGTVRPFYLYGVGEGEGTEARLDLAAHVMARLGREHGAGVDVTRMLRWSQDPGGPVATDAATVLRVFYAYDLR